MKFNEVKFRKAVKPQILKCRDGDWNHAQRVVEWVKKLRIGRKGLPLLIVAAYIHDIGWRGVLPFGRISFQKLLEFEKQANQNTEPYVSALLKELGYSKGQVKTVNRLIRAADAHTSNTDDEAVVVDGDNLSKLSVDHLQEKFKKSEWVKLYKLWEKELPKRIKTKKGKKLYPALLAELKNSIQELN